MLPCELKAGAVFKQARHPHPRPPPVLLAGIAVGAVAVAVAAAAAGWAVLRRRRQRRSHAGAVVPAKAANYVERESEASCSEPPRLLQGSPLLGSSGMNSPLLSTAAQLPAVLAEAGLVAHPPSGPGSWHSSRRSQLSAVTGRSAGLPKSVVSTGQMLCGRPVAASPFAAVKGCGPASAASPFDGGPSPAGGCGAWQWPPPGAVLSELVAQRALEDAVPTIDEYTVGGSLSGGTVGSAGDTQLSGTRAERAPLDADALPAALQEWLIPAADIRVLERPGHYGEKWVLGEGARCGGRRSVPALVGALLRPSACCCGT